MSNIELMGGKLQLYRRGKSSFWWCAASVGGKQRRSTTKKESLQQAQAIAEDWYARLRGLVDPDTLRCPDRGALRRFQREMAATLRELAPAPSPANGQA